MVIAVENGAPLHISVCGTVLAEAAFDKQDQQQSRTSRGVRLVGVTDIAATTKRPLPPIPTSAGNA